MLSLRWITGAIVLQWKWYQCDFFRESTLLWGGVGRATTKLRKPQKAQPFHARASRAWAVTLTHVHYNSTCVRKGFHKTRTYFCMVMHVCIYADAQIRKKIQRIPENDYLELGTNSQSLKKRQEESEEDLTLYHHKISAQWVHIILWFTELKENCWF